MRVIVNKKEVGVQEGMLVSDLLEERGAPRAGVWVNGRQLLLAEYNTWILMPGDEVRILRIVAGG